MKFKAFIALSAAVLLVGCATTDLPKDYVVSPEVMAQAQRSFDKELGFKKALYLQSIRMAQQGYCATPRPLEPFLLGTTGFIPDTSMPMEQRVAFGRLGMDRKVRVIWVDPAITPNVSVGDEVTRIHARDTNAENETELWVAIRRARYDVQAGQPIEIQMKGGRVTEVARRLGCESGTLASEFDQTPLQLGFNLTPAVKVPGSLFKQAESQDDIRWLAAFALYMTASPEAESRRMKAQAATVVQGVGGVALSFVPGVNYVLNQSMKRTILYLGLDGIEDAAVEFATREVHAQGGDPTTGIEMIARLQAQGIKLGNFDFKPEQFAKARALAKDLEAGTATAPSYKLPKL